MAAIACVHRWGERLAVLFVQFGRSRDSTEDARWFQGSWDKDRSSTSFGHCADRL